MIFQNRQDAGKKLAKKLIEKKIVDNKDKNMVVVSLLKGGVIIGNEISKKLNCSHFILPVAKIAAPFQEELAIGALCFDKIYLNQKLICSYLFDKKTINNQIKKAQEKFLSHCQIFKIKKKDYKKIKNKVVILTDDGIATGATVKIATVFLKSQNPKKIILAAPVAPSDFKNKDFDQILIFYKDPCLSAVSQYYLKFPQISNEEVKKTIQSFKK